MVKGTVASQDMPPIIANAQSAICPDNNRRHKKAVPLTFVTAMTFLIAIYFLNNFFEPSGSSLSTIIRDDKKWVRTRKFFMKMVQPFKKTKDFT